MRELERELDTLLNTPGGYPFATWLELILPFVPAPGAIEEGSTFHLATKRVKVDNVDHRVELRAVGDLIHSVNRETNRTSVTLQNITTAWGQMLLGKAEVLQGGTVRMGRHWKAPEGGAEFVQPMFQGVVEGIGGDTRGVVLALLSDIYAILSIGGGRLAERNCQAVYNSPYLRSIGSTLGRACAYAGTLPSCSKTFQGPNGCIAHFDTDAPAHFQGLININSKAAAVVAIPPQKNNQMYRDGDGNPQPMRTITKVVGADFEDNEADDETILTLTGGGCGKFSWAASIGDDNGALSTQQVITMRPQQPGAILGWSLFTDTACTITVDVRKSAFATYPLDSGDSMPGSGNEPQITSDDHAEGDTTAWGVIDFLGGDVLEVVLTAVDTPPNYLSVVLWGEFSACDNPVSACLDVTWEQATCFTIDGNTVEGSLLEAYDESGCTNGHRVGWVQTAETLSNPGDYFEFTLPNVDDSFPELYVGLSNLDDPACTPVVIAYSYCYFPFDPRFSFYTSGTYLECFYYDDDDNQQMIAIDLVRTGATVLRLVRNSDSEIEFFMDGSSLGVATGLDTLPPLRLAALAGSMGFDSEPPNLQPKVTACVHVE